MIGYKPAPCFLLDGPNSQRSRLSLSFSASLPLRKALPDRKETVANFQCFYISCNYGIIHSYNVGYITTVLGSSFENLLLRD